MLVESHTELYSPHCKAKLSFVPKSSLCQFNIEFALVVNLARLAYPWRWVLGCTTQILKKILWTIEVTYIWKTERNLVLAKKMANILLTLLTISLLTGVYKYIKIHSQKYDLLRMNGCPTSFTWNKLSAINKLSLKEQL